MSLEDNEVCDGKLEKEYVLGFAFERQRVALIHKERPPWQAGRMNGIGGKMEPYEIPYRAMVREFEEETGRHTEIDDWQKFAELGDGVTFKVHVFKAFLPLLENLQTTTDEEVEIVYIHDVDTFKFIPNLTWLIPMAMSMPWEAAKCFCIKEVYAQG